MAERDRAAVDRLVAASLQRVLLPPTLPRIDGWSLSTLYEPAGEAVLVGGDFYDWFALPDGDTVLVFGDVAGKGPVAGALGMSLRKVLKGVTHAVNDPFAAIPVLERALADELVDAFASMCLLRVRAGSGRVTMLLAGHPEPWLRRGGVFVPVHAPPNRLLGIGLGTTEWHTLTLDLCPGDLLFVYTDGLSEAKLGDGRLYGEGGLQDFLASLPEGLPAYEVVVQADAQLRRLVGSPKDDVIVGALGFGQSAWPSPDKQAISTGEIRTLRLAPSSGSTRIARRFAVDACAEWHLSEEVSNRVELVVSELVTNAVIHARGAHQLRLTLLGRQVRVEVHDDSPALFDFASATAPGPGGQTIDEHGRGLVAVRAMAEQVGVDPGGSGKVVWASLAIDANGPTRTGGGQGP